MTAPVWRVELHHAAVRDLRRLGAEAERRVLRYLRERIAGSENPRRLGHALTGDRKGLWRYRLGDYRIVAASKMTASWYWLQRSVTGVRSIVEAGIKQHLCSFAHRSRGARGFRRAAQGSMALAAPHPPPAQSMHRDCAVRRGL